MIKKIVLGAAILVMVTPPVLAETTVTVKIKRVIEGRNPDSGAADLINDADTVGVGDYYARIRIGSAGFERNRGEFVERRNFRPDWRFSRNVSEDSGVIPIVLQLWDADTLENNDDIIDINPIDDAQELVLSLDLENCTWTGDTGPNGTIASGDGDHEHFGALEGGERGRLWFGITCGPEDYDQDNIPDEEERFGVFDFFDGAWQKVVDLPALGASPCRKTILVELDAVAGSAPRADAMRMVQDAFDIAPIPTPVAPCPYTDEGPAQPGIDLIVDIDDTTLPDNFGTTTPTGPVFPLSDVELYKGEYFDPAREPYFHYAVWVPDAIPFPGRCCVGERNSDFIGEAAPSGPGQAESDAALFMHELGHALGLTHAGGAQIDLDANGNPTTANCKPNYLSIMNYNFSGGLLDLATGQRVLDYSRSELSTLNEMALSEQIPIDPTSSLRTRWADQNGTGQNGPVNQSLNWSGNVDASDVDIFELNTVAVDLNNRGSRECGLAWTDDNVDGPVQQSELDPNPTPGERLSGYDDWENLSYLGPLSERLVDANTEYVEQTEEERAAVEAEFQAALRCFPPQEGVWRITRSCTIWRDVVAPGGLRIGPGVEVKISSGVHLDIDLTTHALRISPGGQLNIAPGARID